MVSHLLHVHREGDAVGLARAGQATVHEGEYILHVASQLLPRLVALGFPLQGLRFEWDDSETYTPEQQVAYELLMLEHFDVDQKYFEEKYGIKILGKKQPTMQPTAEEQLAHRPPFFDRAPPTTGHYTAATKK